MKLTTEQLKRISELKDDGYINVTRHPTFPLNIASYSHKAQFDKKWEEMTMMCRGLIYQDDGTVVARPFKKFFNLGEAWEPNKGAPALPDEPYQTFEKLDGSLGILYWWDGKPYIATRGSFQSDQAARAQIILDVHLMHARPEFLEMLKLLEEQGKTTLWEIIFPENRIVVEYGCIEQLRLIAIVDKDTGRSSVLTESAYDWMGSVGLPTGNIEGEEWDCNCVDVVKIHGDTLTGLPMEKMMEDRPNREGYVLYFPQADYRVKIKHEEYKRLHRLLTGINERRIWEVLAENGTLDHMLDAVPDEFYDFVKKTSNSLKDRFAEIFLEAEKYQTRALWEKDRAAQAAVIKKCAYPGVAFAMLDGKDPRRLIWSLIRPSGSTKSFKESDL